MEITIITLFTCGMIAIFLRMSVKPNCEMSIPSIMTAPLLASVSLNKQDKREVLPAPVLPTTPI